MCPARRTCSAACPKYCAARGGLDGMIYDHCSVLSPLPWSGYESWLSWVVCCRDRASDAVYVHDVTMFLPQTEFQFFAERAAASSSFVVQLMGK